MNDSQNGENETKEEGALKDGFQVVKNRKGKGKIGEQEDGVRRSSRLEAYMKTSRCWIWRFLGRRLKTHSSTQLTRTLFQILMTLLYVRLLHL